MQSSFGVTLSQEYSYIHSQFQTITVPCNGIVVWFLVYLDLRLSLWLSKQRSRFRKSDGVIHVYHITVVSPTRLTVGDERLCCRHV